MTKIFDDYFRILVTLWCHQNQEIVTFFLKSLVLRRNNTIEDPEFKQALSDLNPDVIYEKLKVICKRNAKGKFILLRHHVPKHCFLIG